MLRLKPLGKSTDVLHSVYVHSRDTSIVQFERMIMTEQSQFQEMTNDFNVMRFGVTLQY